MGKIKEEFTTREEKEDRIVFLILDSASLAEGETLAKGRTISRLEQRARDRRLFLPSAKRKPVTVLTLKKNHISSSHESLTLKLIL